MKQKITLIILAALTSTIFNLAAEAPKTLASSGQKFDPGRIIDDAVFYNSDSMSTNEIQRFLNSKGSSCDTNGTGRATDWGRGDISRATLASYIRNGTHGYTKNTNFHAPPYTCLKDFKQDTPSVSADATVGCSAVRAKNNTSSSQIIYDVSKSCGINPQVLLVLLEKEQSLVSDIWPLDLQYERATGFACPDNVGGACDPKYNGFFRQVYGAAYQFKRYQKYQNEYNYVANRTNNIYWQVTSNYSKGNFTNPTGHPSNMRDGQCGHAPVRIQNQATAALYIYTPYQPNKAALDNFPGTGDDCSAYGNRNFWYIFTGWFGNTQSTPFFRIGNTDPIYILGANNDYYHVSSWDTMRAYGWGNNIDRVAKYSNGYLSGKKNSGKLPRLARFESDNIYLSDRGNLHRFTSRDSLSLHGHQVGDEAELRGLDSHFFKISTNMNSILRDVGRGHIHLMEDAQKRHFEGTSAYDTGSPPFSSRPYTNLSSSYIDTIPYGAPIYRPGTLLRIGNTPQVYLVNNTNEKFYIPSPSTMNAYGFSFKDVKSVNKLQSEAYPNSGDLDKFVTSKSGRVYLIDSGRKWTLPQNEEFNTRYKISVNELNQLEDRILNLIPTAKNLTKAIQAKGKNEVYILENGEKRHVKSRDEMKSIGISYDDVTVLSGDFVRSIKNAK